MADNLNGGGGGGKGVYEEGGAAAGFVRHLSDEHPLDMFITGIKVVDRPYPSCTVENRIQCASQYRSQRAKKPTDHFTAYLFGPKTTAQVPIEKHCYIRVPDAWIPFRQNQTFINSFLTELVKVLVPRKYASAYRRTIRATLVMRRHGIGYRPKITSPPTPDSREFPFLHVFCSNPLLYNAIRSKMSSKTTKREFWRNDFYTNLFQGANGTKFLLKYRDPKGLKVRSNVVSERNFLQMPHFAECFVAHEMSINADTVTLSNLGITSNGWVRISRGQLFDNTRRASSVSNSSFEVVGNVVAKGIPLAEIEETKCADMTTVALDIECHSESRGFPQYTNVGDCVNYVGVVQYSSLDVSQTTTHCFCLGDVDLHPTDDGKTVDTAFMHVYQHETAMLNGVSDFIAGVGEFVGTDVASIHTFNGNTFDWKYMDGRATLANFVQSCGSLEQFWTHVQTYHRCHLNYKELTGELADLDESFNDYGEITKKQFDERSREIYSQINEQLGYGTRRAWREPQPKTVHHAIWGLWPKEFIDTPATFKARNAEIAFRNVEKMYEYFSTQPPITYHFMHKLRAQKGDLVYKRMGSKAMGENFLMYPDLSRIHVDQFTYFKNSLFRLNEYNLNFIANHFLKVSKYDMPYKQLFEDYESGDTTKRRKIADYCVQDCDLLRRLDAHANVSLTYIFLYKMTRTPMIDLSLRGQQIRVFNCLYKKAVSINAIFNSKRAHAILQDYQGATVLDPKPGLHGGPNTWVEVLDFQSLYPSIIIAMLLCMMNLVLPDNLSYVLALEKAGKIPPLHRVQITEKTTYYFSRNPNCIIASELRRLLDKRIGVKGVMKKFKKDKTSAQTELDTLTRPYILKKLGQAKEALDQLQETGQSTIAPKQLEQEFAQWTRYLKQLDEWPATDPTTLEQKIQTLSTNIAKYAHGNKMQNVLQLSIKIVMNSFYGFFGVKEGMMPGMQPIAIATTFYGRDYIQRTKRYLQNLFDTHEDYANLNMDVVYGDSVTGDTTLIVRHQGTVRVMCIDQVHTLFPDAQWTTWRGDKLCLEFDPDDAGGVETWSTDENGRGKFVKVRRLIRHSTTKAIHRVVTPTGVVDCTSDHSLLRPDGTKVSPQQVEVEQELMHTNLPKMMDEVDPLDITPMEAFDLGVYVGCNHVGQFVAAASSNALATVEKFGDQVRNTSGELRIPEGILFHPNKQIAKQFWFGLLQHNRYPEALGHAENCKLHIRGKLRCTGLFMLASRLNRYIKICESMYGMFILQTSKYPIRTPTSITSSGIMFKAGATRTVYDLEMADDLHRFHVGPGNLVVHNTDSVFVKVWPIPNLKRAIEVGIDMGERTTREEFRNSIILEFEKVANPHLAFAEKKSYIQRVWTSDKIDSGYVYISGVVEKRRDNSSFTRKMYHVCRESIIPPIEKGATEIHFDTVEEIEERCAQVLANELGKLEDDVVPLDDYVITKSLSRAPEGYKHPVPSHVALALRIKQRIRDGEIVRMPPISGDRLPFVVCEHPTSVKVGDKVEDVDYFKEKGDKVIDRHYYAKGSTKSITQLYGAFMDVKPFFEATKQALTTQQLVRRGQTRLVESKDGARSIAYSHLFYSRQPPKRKTVQLDIFGKPVEKKSKSTTRKKKKKRKVRKVKPRFKPLF